MLTDSVVVGAVRYRVSESEDLIPDGMSGQIRFPQCEIRLSPGMDLQWEYVTLWHEIIHGILVSAGHREHEHHEEIIDIISHGVVQVLRDNPDLLRRVYG